MNVTTCAEQPHARPRRNRPTSQHEAGLLEQVVLFRRVAAPTRRHHVLPGVCPAPASRHHVVDVLSLGTAVLTAMTVASKDRAPSDRDSCLARNPNVLTQANHGGLWKRDSLGVIPRSGLVDGLGFVVQHQQQRSAGGNDTDWLVSGVQDQRTTKQCDRYLILRQLRRIIPFDASACLSRSCNILARCVNFKAAFLITVGPRACARE